MVRRSPAPHCYAECLFLVMIFLPQPLPGASLHCFSPAGSLQLLTNSAMLSRQQHSDGPHCCPPTAVSCRCVVLQAGSASTCGPKSMRTSALLQRLLVALLALHAAVATYASEADVVQEALKLHAQSTVLPTHLLEDQQLFSSNGRQLLADSRQLQAAQSSGRYVLIKNPTMQGGR